ncbi:unnamed protein product [Didymodactylos carnosus]|uniref:histone deacetylase n=1 Tax=Didymodactylos carnosus TaxID=1234261 RepID=A0A815ML12_9BILA|nr:unnamed protein product [Didymodactylos carnosus]CAF4303640.1 unnamed protein product [Didymodactylos carnosus]
MRQLYPGEKCKNYSNVCLDCDDTNENWLCLTCGEIRCSRYINNHNEEHWLFTLLTASNDAIGHCLALGLRDLSIWCYLCKSYVKNIRLEPILKQVEHLKFPSIEDEPQQLSMPSTLSALMTSPPTTVQPLKTGSSLSSSDSYCSTDETKPMTIVTVATLLHDHDRSFDPLTSIINDLGQCNLLAECSVLKSHSATIDELICVHASDYVNILACSEKNVLIRQEINEKNSIFCKESTFLDARNSAGAIIDIVKYVVENKNAKNGFAFVRSPGHRAKRKSGDGHCIFNNIALAVDSILPKIINDINQNHPFHLDGATPVEEAICHMIHALTPSKIDSLPSTPLETSINSLNSSLVNRVLIIDLDIHHGSGIQEIFYSNPNVLYISIHTRDISTMDSNYDQCGSDKGLGYNINIPWIITKTFSTITDVEYIAAMNEIIMPIAREFDPDLVLVCGSFVNSYNEQKLLISMTTDLYSWITQQLCQLANGKVIFVLDGECNGDPTCIESILKVLLDKNDDKNNRTIIMKSNADHINYLARKSINIVKDYQKQYWKCFR